jgi:glutathione S-transferase
MKLYFAPGSCALASHIALYETGVEFSVEQVDLKSKTTAGGQDFKTINHKGYVPVLQLLDGQILTEGPAILQYIADRKPESKLAPTAGTFERYRLQEWLNYISAELHKSFSPLFKPDTPEAYKSVATDALKAKFAFVEEALEGKLYLMGEQFTVADAYLFTVLRWAPITKLDMSQFPNLQQYQQRVKARPGVHKALEAQGLVKH